VRSGASVNLTTRLTDAKTSNPIAGVHVYLYARAGRSGAFEKIAKRTTDANGRALATRTVRSLHQYRWKFNGNSRHKATTSAIGTISIR
jgi:5-hydroxyisourate hydrolase-like protein (transthyretin family)